MSVHGRARACACVCVRERERERERERDSRERERERETQRERERERERCTCVSTVLSRASAHPCVSAHPPVLISLLSGRLLCVSAHLVFIPVLHNTMQYTNWPCRG